MDADVRELAHRAKRRKRPDDVWARADHIDDVSLRQGRAAHSNRQRMPSRVAGLQMHRIIVLVVLRSGPMMLVCSEPVMVLGMFVIGVLVNVQRRDLAGGRGQDQSENERPETMHNPSV